MEQSLHNVTDCWNDCLQLKNILEKTHFFPHISFICFPTSTEVNVASKQITNIHIKKFFNQKTSANIKVKQLDAKIFKQNTTEQLLTHSSPTRIAQCFIYTINEAARFVTDLIHKFKKLFYSVLKILQPDKILTEWLSLWSELTEDLIEGYTSNAITQIIALRNRVTANNCKTAEAKKKFCGIKKIKSNNRDVLIRTFLGGSNTHWSYFITISSQWFQMLYYPFSG